MTKPPYKNHVLLAKYKLHLDEASGPHPPLPNGLTVVDAIADYLRLFHAHVVQVSDVPILSILAFLKSTTIAAGCWGLFHVGL